jgi:hypothetical protein
MSKLVDIYRSDWQYALAAGAYQMILADKPEFLDKHEERQDMAHLVTLEYSLRQLTPERDWDGTLKFFIRRVALNYIMERMTGRNASAGGQMTLIGHVRNYDLAKGFLATLAWNIDGGETEQRFHEYTNIENDIQ